ncbi:hypothetical protein FRB90_008319 [Tulasnella sp. 427]|nr:hypothetical protein FRB90_008319 [Tulasnella sp. 427]
MESGTRISLFASAPESVSSVNGAVHGAQGNLDLAVFDPRLVAGGLAGRIRQAFRRDTNRALAVKSL